MIGIPSFLLPSQAHQVTVSWAAVALGGGAMTIARIGADARPWATALAFVVAASLAFALTRRGGARLGCAGLLATALISAAFCLVSLAGTIGVIASRAGCTGGVGTGEILGPGAGALLAASLVAVVSSARARGRGGAKETLSGADARATALGLWLCAAGAAATLSAQERRPVTLHCDEGVSDVHGLACQPNPYSGRTLNCEIAVPMRPLAELAGANTLAVGIALVMHALLRRRRRWAWMRRAGRGEIPGARILPGGGSIAFDRREARDVYREATQPEEETLLIEDEANRPRPVLALGAHLIAATAGLLLATLCGYMYVMAGEAERYQERYRNVPGMR